MMNFWDRLFMASMLGKELSWGLAAIGAIFFVICSLGVVIYGVVSGYWQWCVVGGIVGVFSAICAAICIYLNIRQNSNRW
jgi:uncharacterized membrane protein